MCVYFDGMGAHVAVPARSRSNSKVQPPCGGALLEEISKIIGTRRVQETASGPPGATTQFGDVNAAHKVSMWLANHGQASSLRPSSGLTLWDFRKSPTVLIGYLDNPWSLILLSQLRYRAGVDAISQSTWIEDQQNPNKREWLQGAPNQSSSNVDYAVISRFFNPETGSWMIAIAGLGPNGTDAASQLLTDPIYDPLLPTSLRSSKNFQLVIKANEISGKLGAPKILALHTW